MKELSLNILDIAENSVKAEATLTEILIEENTYVFPKLEFGKPNQDQEPLMVRKLYDRLMNL